MVQLDCGGFDINWNDEIDLSENELGNTAYYDLKKKYKAYERYGVKEYWIVDPEDKSIEVFGLADGKLFGCTERGNRRSGVIAAVRAES